MSPNPDLAIASHGLTKVYRSRFSSWSRTACNDITLQIPRSSAFGLLGANGAGKTTFLKMVLSVVHPTSGASYVFGRNSFDPEARREIGYLPENHRFPTYMTARSMLDYYAGMSGMTYAQRRTRMNELLDLVGLTSSADVRLRKYSKGMLQRVGLAQALMHKPKLLVLDEPGDGVDPVGRRLIRDILRDQQAQGVTVFINSHLLAEVELFCDRVAILKSGQVTLQGEVKNLTLGKGYKLRVNTASAGLFDALRERGALAQRSPDGVDFLFPDLATANQAIDEIRREGGLVQSFAESRSTLEDVFMEAVQTPAAQAA